MSAIPLAEGTLVGDASGGPYVLRDHIATVVRWDERPPVSQTGHRPYLIGQPWMVRAGNLIFKGYLTSAGPRVDLVTDDPATNLLEPPAERGSAEQLADLLWLVQPEGSWINKLHSLNDDESPSIRWPTTWLLRNLTGTRQHGVNLGPSTVVGTGERLDQTRAWPTADGWILAMPTVPAEQPLDADATDHSSWRTYLATDASFWQVGPGGVVTSSWSVPAGEVPDLPWPGVLRSFGNIEAIASPGGGMLYIALLEWLPEARSPWPTRYPRYLRSLGEARPRGSSLAEALGGPRFAVQALVHATGPDHLRVIDWVCTYHDPDRALARPAPTAAAPFLVYAFMPDADGRVVQEPMTPNRIDDFDDYRRDFIILGQDPGVVYYDRLGEIWQATL